MKKHFAIKISGVVQGVYFRASTRERADALKITGFVRNEPDGSVYVEAEGDESNLDVFIQWCHQGPAHAVVEKCEVQSGTVKGFSSFTIQR
ncbi:MAG TPA: acylphosphatase [Chryseosolibacter sp.]|jgi:acylphosphatase|nr:acylphosphatase [Chryseosolibacter sp.]